ncbi:mitochondrial ribosomal protein L43 [Lycorma delicatula]|uniref:mitochondrial ribosomal protein L43 n=1 Tax=Lycorma delicatula TaxID=130591 RepID=UPI003F5165BD
MSNKHLFLLSGFPRAPLQNGIGRYVCQLKRVTLKFCKSHGTSKGMREFIENDLVDFAKSNPGIAVYVKPRRHRLPYIYAEFLNGEIQNIECHTYTYEEIKKWLNLLKTRSGMPAIRYRKLWHTDNPSIQGIWSPFTNRDPAYNMATFPMEDFIDVPNKAPTATELLLKMFEEQKQNNTSTELNSDSPDNRN